MGFLKIYTYFYYQSSNFRSPLMLCISDISCETSNVPLYSLFAFRTGKIVYQYKLWSHVKPKMKPTIFFARSERFNNALHHMYTFGWMTKLYFSPIMAGVRGKIRWWIGVKTHCMSFSSTYVISTGK